MDQSQLWIDKIVHVIRLWRTWDKTSPESLSRALSAYVPFLPTGYSGGNCIDLSQRSVQQGEQLIGAQLTPNGPISHVAIFCPNKGIYDPGFRFTGYLSLCANHSLINQDGDRFWIKTIQPNQISVGRFVQTYQKESEMIFHLQALSPNDIYSLQISLLRKKFMNSVVGGNHQLIFAKFNFTSQIWISSFGSFSTDSCKYKRQFPDDIWETMKEFEHTVPFIPDFFWE